MSDKYTPLKDQSFRDDLVKHEFSDVLGQQKTKEHLKSAFLAGRNIIVVGQPGIGKTTLARSVAKIIPNKENEELFVRVQGSPDLTAEDLIGDIDPIKALKFGPTSMEAFSPGKIFKANGGILFFDEINRCSEKLQNTLLQVLEEKKVTLGTYTVDLDANFIFIGTMNPDDTSTEPLSDVFLDRFDLVYMGYPENAEIEKKIVEQHGTKLIEYPEWLLDAIVKFVQDLRHDSNLEKKPGVRATLGLYERSQTNAIVKGKTEVNMDDVNDVMESVIAHRIKLKPSVKYLKNPEEYVKEEFNLFLQRGDYL